MHLDLTDEEAAALAQELHEIVENDRYPFSPRIRTLRGTLAKLRPEPAREPLPPPKITNRRERRREGDGGSRDGPHPPLFPAAARFVGDSPLEQRGFEPSVPHPPSS
jgi:hypothetical protein